MPVYIMIIQDSKNPQIKNYIILKFIIYIIIYVIKQRKTHISRNFSGDLSVFAYKNITSINKNI